MEDPPLPLFTRTQVVLGRLQKNKNKNKILCPQRGKGAVGLQGRLQVPALPGDYSSSLKHKVCSFARWPDSNTGCVGLLWRCRGDQIIYIKKKDSAWHRESTFWFLTVTSELLLLVCNVSRSNVILSPFGDPGRPGLILFASSRGEIRSHGDSGLPWWSSGWDSKLPIQGTQVPSLVTELDPTRCS